MKCSTMIIYHVHRILITKKKKHYLKITQNTVANKFYDPLLDDYSK